VKIKTLTLSGTQRKGQGRNVSNKSEFVRLFVCLLRARCFWPTRIAASTEWVVVDSSF
jgi:hypothetical protein